MGHASVKTTERYMHAQMAADLVDQATAAFTERRRGQLSMLNGAERELVERLGRLDSDAVDRVLSAVQQSQA